MRGLSVGRRQRGGAAARRRDEDGSQGGIRTPDQPVNSRLLYH